MYKNKKKDTLRFERTVKIIENTLSDTIVFAGGILSPKYVGNLDHTQIKDRKDILLDLRYLNPPADRIWISRYKNRIAKGILKVEFIENID